MTEEGYFIYDHLTATVGQRVFRTSKPYIGGTLMVYLNGILVVGGEESDYIEVDSRTILFNYELEEGDRLIIASMFASDQLVVDVISSNPKNIHAIYTKYGSVEKLAPNSVFQVFIATKRGDVSWSFVSKCDPFHASISKIRSDTGDLLNGATDEEIGRVIYFNSKEADENKDEFLEENTIDNEVSFERRLKKWVRYKTNLDLINAIYLSLAGLSGSRSKRISEIQIEDEVTLPKLDEMLARFKTLFAPLEGMFQAAPALSLSFVKAGTSYAYPRATRDSF